MFRNFSRQRILFVFFIPHAEVTPGPGRFGKKNKRRALNKHRAWTNLEKRITVGQEKFKKNNVLNYVGKKIILKEITMLKKKSD